MSISLAFGNLGTMSPLGLESWGYLLGFSHLAFWGYATGRLAILAAAKRSSGQWLALILACAMVLSGSLGLTLLLSVKWDSPVSLAVIRAGPETSGSKDIGTILQ